MSRSHDCTKPTAPPEESPLQPIKPEDVKLFSEWQYVAIEEQLENLNHCVAGMLAGVQARENNAGEGVALLADSLDEVKGNLNLLARLPAFMDMHGAYDHAVFERADDPVALLADIAFGEDDDDQVAT